MMKVLQRETTELFDELRNLATLINNKLLFDNQNMKYIFSDKRKL